MSLTSGFGSAPLVRKQVEESLKSEAIRNTETFLTVLEKLPVIPNFKKVCRFDDGELP